MTKRIVGFTASTFDLLHAGHILMLEEAKKQCNYLVVGLQVDPSIDRPTKNKPVQSLIERTIQLEAVKYVDRIVSYTTEEDLLLLLEAVKPDVRILGEEYKDKKFTGDHLQMKYYFNSRNHNLSSSELRKRIAVSEQR